MTSALEIAAAKHALRQRMEWHWGGKHTRRWHGLPAEIAGIGFGIKRTKGKVAEKDCLRVYVRRKKTLKSLSRRQRIPRSVDGIPVDVVAIGSIRPHAAPGESISNGRRVTGTLACITTAAGVQYLLGSWHVLTNSYGVDGDPVYMPSLEVDGGAAVVGTLIGTPIFHLNGGSNAFDASVAQVSPGVAIDTLLAGHGAISLPFAPPAYGPVMKQGAATSYTTGVIDGLSEDVPITYNDQASDRAILTGQLAIVGDAGAFSDEGDSGALVCTPSLNPVAVLVCAGTTPSHPSGFHSFASPIKPILDFYGVSIQT
jgi:hypothetical protein